MCGISGLILKDTKQNAVLDIHESLGLLQHRGQDSAGITTCGARGRFYQCKANGMVNEVFTQDRIEGLHGSMGIGHVRYPTAGTSSISEAQPFYVNSPYGIAFAHNGNLTNSVELENFLDLVAHRHINTNSDSELLLNMFAYNLEKNQKHRINEEDVFRAIKELYTQCVGGYACIAMIAGFGIIGFRDPNAIRPLSFGCRPVGAKGMTNGSGDEGLKGDYMFASESAVMEALGFDHFEPVLPGEAIIVTKTKVTRRKLIETPEWRPCIFEYVYFARPDSIIDDIPVSDARLEMGTKLAHTVRRLLGDKHDIDVVIPVPDTSRIIALQLSQVLNLPYREGFNKNRYVGRTFIMPGQENRRKSVRRKLNAMHYEFNNKNVLIVDDSIVRGTTSSEIIQMARDAGAKKVYFASAAPAIRFQNVYGIDMPSRKELVAYNRTEDEISTILGADKVIYQTLDDLVDCCKKFNPSIKCFEASVFDGNYVTGGVSKKYLNTLESQRSDSTLHSQTVSPVASGISNIFEDS